jgi:transcriptional regulator with GAF, ATPase, and Fis domain
MIGRSAVMQDAFSLIRRLAPHVRNVLITGETGTGKELVAKAFQALGPRRERAFVPVNCSAVVDTLSESEMFGHVRGAFTGATENKIGLFEQADRGTLFLDEIGELPLALQAKLLRVLETGEIQRVGSVERRRVDVHVFAATNRNLRAEVATFVREFSARLRKPIAGISTNAERLLVSADWEGNVRELRNVIERACVLAEGDLLTSRDLVGLQARGADDPGAAPGTAAPPRPAMPVDDPSDTTELDQIQKAHILQILERTHGNKKAAAELLGISRRKLYRFLEQHAIRTPVAPRDA